ncbi:unnamed protein product [Cylicocyclus nassatus]|uniref:C-type lectin domain-containing protein n=1 Tax=Cylicocyclus nassatus TaxID=53992 RepID=A0AA36M783_CYLNA|nr:unnamed protein product [Cylicocyclus nassatus]
MNFLLFALASLVTGFVSPSIEQISRSSVQSLGSHLNRSDAACPGRCESGWTYFDKTDACYKTFFWKPFYEAESICRNVGAHLTSIHNADENHFVADLAMSGLKIDDSNKGTWIGLRRADYLNSEKWLWTDGTEVGFLAWAPTEPNNMNRNERCVESYTDITGDALTYHKWNDLPCDSIMRSFVCKKLALQ